MEDGVDSCHTSSNNNSSSSSSSSIICVSARSTTASRKMSAFFSGGGLGVHEAASGNNSSSRCLLGGVDAQQAVDADCSLFVANLREDIDDEALEAALVAHFGKVSRVWCKIRRQANNVPFAIMTYARKEHAETAREVYHGAKIHGRPCRVEKLQANRHWIIWKKEGKIMPLEATQAMVPLGDVATVKHISIEDAEKLDVPTSAMVVTFVKWDPARQVAKHFSKHPYFLVRPQNARKSDKQRNVDFLTHYEQCRRSVHLNNLPGEVAEEAIREVLGQFGVVSKVYVNRMYNEKGLAVHRTWASVEFESEAGIDEAIDMLQGRKTLGTESLGISHKKPKEHVAIPTRSGRNHHHFRAAFAGQGTGRGTNNMGARRLPLTASNTTGSIFPATSRNATMTASPGMPQQPGSGNFVRGHNRGTSMVSPGLAGPAFGPGFFAPLPLPTPAPTQGGFQPAQGGFQPAQGAFQPMQGGFQPTPAPTPAPAPAPALAHMPAQATQGFGPAGGMPYGFPTQGGFFQGPPPPGM
ncbi:hypothetical protein P8C59_001166 [Phyllachora maydis]|uniref:RRM domain-containing protein n=1 Tax=Phyllachora maydis TaxID=1825666 RepID=A0AAD9M7I4_9PEZI|nr:hypothetical protein P8C59_001166 [Phyllachora maydis]